MSIDHAHRPARWLAATLVLAATGWAAPATLGTPTATGQAAGTYRNASGSFESQVLYWTNVQRRAHGVRPLRPGSCADRYAESWVHHLAGTTSFYHQRLGPILSGCGAHRAGENLASGTASARTTVARWMRSPGHRRNLLSRSFTRLGVGAAYSSGGRLYTVQDFTA